MTSYNQNWDLDALFPGGSESQEYATYLQELEKSIKALYVQIQEKTPAGVDQWVELLNGVQIIAKRVRHASAFVGCLTAQNVRDSQARLLGGKVRTLNAAYASVLTSLDKHILNLPEREWAQLLEQPALSDLHYNLEERRTRAKEKLPAEHETLVNNLSVDGYHAWSNLYDTVVSRLRVHIEENGQTVSLSPGQAANKLNNPDRDFREHVFERWEEAWSNAADYCALALNHLAGFRINLYRQRGWDDVLQEPMANNRMTLETLNTMWSTIDRNKDRLVQYLNRKKELLGTESLSWHDVSAPIARSASRMSFDEAAEFIIEQFAGFSPRMAEFTRMTFEKRWIEAEDRADKRPGAFCTSFPEAGESRVFMTFSGSMGNVSTLAHELGHAYHQSVMNDLPPMAQQYAMNVAETASTFAEVTVADAALRRAQTPQEKIAMLDGSLQRAVALLMNIQARFLFETRFYEERKQGLVSVKRLNELMVEAQKEAFAGTLGTYHPHFWASKLHFYSTSVPFYNFPYTFGYLFATGVYAQAQAEGSAFEQKYINLLRDTGRMQVEDLALQHLGADLRKPDFWQNAIDTALAGLDEFLRLTEK